MISFQVNDMTCGHCINAITKAVMAADKDAAVKMDLAAHRVDIEGGAADTDGLASAIKAAGYTPRAVEGGSVLDAPSPTAGKQGGCCCS
jgi:copper chaperone